MLRRFTKDRLSEVGQRSARRAQADHKDLIFSCDFKGINDEAGTVDPNLKITKNSEATFEWTARATNVDETCIVTVKCDNACVRGVPFPQPWRTAVKCLDLGDVAKASAARMKRQHEAQEVECEMLGVPKPCPLPAADTTLQVGAVVTLQHGDANLDYLLCARVHGDRWFVHRGTFDDHRLQDDQPFDPSGLVVKDILRDAYEPDAPPPLVKRRINCHVRGPDLRAAARQRATS